MNEKTILQAYQSTFGAAPDLIVRAPGRINLIGEHTDYNGGFALPAAIDKAIWFAAGRTGNGHLHFHALDLGECWSGDLDSFQKSEKSWVSYLLGVLDEGRKDGLKFGGVRLVFSGDVPLGAGLSSSAAVQSGMIFLMNELFRLGLEKMNLVKLAQRGENHFVGMKCGIMDMFASVMGRQNCAVRLDCRSLEFEYVPFDAPDFTLILCDSGVKHALVDSEYNTRRGESEQGVKLLRQFYPGIETLRDVSPEQVFLQKNALPERIFRRCKFVTEEIRRVELACEALKINDLAALGKLMFDTHRGLRDEYEVSCPELDFLVGQASQNADVPGARIMGGGFGGCTINLVRKSGAAAFLENMKAAFRSQFGRELPCHEVALTDGVEIGKLEIGNWEIGKLVAGQPISQFPNFSISNFQSPHRRWNPLTESWVLVSPHRAQRPWQGQVENLPPDDRPNYDPACYLCPGNRRANGEQTPVYQDVFAFTNDFSALLPDLAAGDFSSKKDTPNFEQSGQVFPISQFPISNFHLLRAAPESGICRVVCFSPRHDLTIPEMETPAIRKVIDLWRQEFEALGSRPDIGYVQIFENKGAIMGCSNPHPHGQIWAQRSIPDEPLKKQKAQLKYFKKHGRTLLSDYLAAELATGISNQQSAIINQSGERLVFENEHFACLVPFWAVWPFEAMLLPKRPMPRITDLTDAECDAFADALRRLTVRYDNLFEVSFPYSAGIHQAPSDGKAHPEWHWHHVFLPPLLRSATVKKFMVGYEMLADPQRDITAEQAAVRLREVGEVHFKRV